MSENDEWRIEMQNLLDMFERESTSSLRKISRCFVSSGRPFDENFRQYFLKKSTIRTCFGHEWHRLDTSFDTILFERFDEERMQMSYAANASVPAIEIASNTHGGSFTAGDVRSLNASERGNMMEFKIENNIDEATIEIVDSDDDDSGNTTIPAANDTSEAQVGSSTSMESKNEVDNFNSEHIDTNGEILEQ